MGNRPPHLLLLILYRIPQVEYVWSRQWTFGTFLFLVNRYLPFADLVLSFHGSSFRLYGIQVDAVDLFSQHYLYIEQPKLAVSSFGVNTHSKA